MSDNNKVKSVYKVISLFSGCGGLDLGFEGGFKSLGKNYAKRKFEVIWANDIDESSCLTYYKNFNSRSICGDIIRLIERDEIPTEADIVIGGFPCQDFSLAGKRKGFDSKRGLLYQCMIETVRRSNPLVFVAENVKGLLSLNGGEAIKKIENDFEALGYHVSTKLYLAPEWGVPQSRERVIIIGTNKKILPKFTHPENGPLNEGKWVNLQTAIGDLEDLPEGAIANHFWSKAKRFPGTQGNSTVNAVKIGPTMRAEHHGNIEFHWNDTRRLSAREAARIQTFPDDFIFYPSTSSAYKQIGNAVPPILAWNVAKLIEDFLEKSLNNVNDLRSEPSHSRGRIRKTLRSNTI